MRFKPTDGLKTKEGIWGRHSFSEKKALTLTNTIFNVVITFLIYRESMKEEITEQYIRSSFDDALNMVMKEMVLDEEQGLRKKKSEDSLNIIRDNI